MPYNGSGVFTVLYDWNNDAANGIKIRSDRMQNECVDFAQGLTNALTKDGQTTPTANLPMGGYKHTNVANGTARTDYIAMGQMQDGKVNWISATGTADAITAFYTPAITVLADGQLFFIRASGANTVTNPTLSVDGLTARTIVKNGGQALSLRDINGAGHELILRYNLANTRFELLNPNSLSGGSYVGPVNTPKSADIASAATTDLSTSTGNYVVITGTTTITSLGTLPAGTVRYLRFAASLILTHNATSLILPTGANITTAAGDNAIFISEGSGNWRCIDYQRANGLTFKGFIPVGVYALTAGQATLDVFIDDLTADYQIELSNVFCSSLSDIMLRLSTDNGSTFISSAASYAHYSWNNIDGPNGTTATYMQATFGNINTSVDGSYTGTFKLFSPGLSTQKTRLTSSGGISNDTEQMITFSNCRRVVAESNNAFRLAPISGTFQGGIIKVYKLVN